VVCENARDPGQNDLEQGRDKERCERQQGDDLDR
jgi:hypothetical protein